VLDDVTYPFGGGQCILATGEGTLVGGSDPRKDGYAAGF
jgi:gamma-glutamyltranspeptidase